MSAISEYAAAQTAYNDQLDTAIEGLAGDIKSLNELIVKLQNTPGPISPEDQASLDALQARGKVIADKLTALDALTENVPTPPAA